jgi:hypothetical protein
VCLSAFEAFVSLRRLQAVRRQLDDDTHVKYLKRLHALQALLLAKALDGRAIGK